MDVYARFAGVYDRFAAEPVYRAGRVAAIRGLGLSPGDRVLDVGCGTGLNLPLLLEAVGGGGRVVGVDRSAEMLEQAAGRVTRLGAGNVVLVRADAADMGTRDVEAGFDAVLFTYALSVVAERRAAWRAALGLLRAGGRAAVVDLQLPTGWARAASPLARLAARAGGSDLTARPWTLLEADLVDVRRWSLRGGHVQVGVGTKAAEAPTARPPTKEQP